jgi:hypothetical protein
MRGDVSGTKQRQPRGSCPAQNSTVERWGSAIRTGRADSPTLSSRSGPRLGALSNLFEKVLDSRKGDDTVLSALGSLLGSGKDGLLETDDLSSEELGVLNEAPLSESVDGSVAVGGSKDVREVEEGVGRLHGLPGDDDSGGGVDEGSVHVEEDLKGRKAWGKGCQQVRRQERERKERRGKKRKAASKKEDERHQEK